MTRRWAAALWIVWCSVALAIVPASTLPPRQAIAQDAPGPGTPGPGLPDAFSSPLEPPVLPPVLPPDTPTATPTDTPSPTPTDTVEPTATPTVTPTPTIAPLQVSPLVAQGATQLPDDNSLLWIGAAGLLVLVGSTVLLMAERRGGK